MVVHSTPSKHRPKRILSNKWGKMSKSSQFHLLCINHTCPCSQQNWRSRDCSYSWEKGTISQKDSGPLCSPPGASQSPTNLSGLPCVPWSLSSQYRPSFCSHSLSFRSSSQALSYLCGSPTVSGNSICYYQHRGIQQTWVFSYDLAGDTRTYQNSLMFPLWKFSTTGRNCRAEQADKNATHFP